MVSIIMTLTSSLAYWRVLEAFIDVLSVKKKEFFAKL